MTESEIELLKSYLDKFGTKVQSIIYGIKVSVKKNGEIKIRDRNGKDIDYGWIVNNIIIGRTNLMNRKK